jgi:hypothetical protein
MLTTKIRTTIIALVAASSFAATSVVPAVSQASKNTGAYSKSSEAKKKKQEHCLASEQTWLSAMEGYDAAEVGSQRATQLAELIDEMRAFGKAEGCSWAIRVRPAETPISGIVAPVGGIQASPEATTSTPVQGITAISSPRLAQ